MEKQNNVPRLRFPEFSDAWKQSRLEKMLQFSNGFNGSAELYGKGIPYISVMDILNNNFITYDSIIGKVDLDGCTAERYTVGFGDVLFQRSSENIEDAGKSNVYIELEKNVVFGGFVIRGKRNSDYNPYYMKYLLDTFHVRKQIMRKAQGAQHINVSQTTLESVVVNIPTIEEQDKIGRIFYNIDNLITLHQRKLDQMKEYKKGMLQKMFPKDGETVPETRFHGFEGEWVKSTLLDLLVQPVSDGPHETPVLVNNGIPFISVDAIVDNKIDFNRKRGYITEEYDLACRKKYSPQRDDVYLVKSGATVGKVAIVETDIRFNIWSPLAAMRTNKELMLPKYLYFYLQLGYIQNEIYEKSIGGTQPNLSMRVLEQFNIKVPDVDEQRKIVIALENLDNLITLQQRKLEQIKEYKKGLLQQMFV